MAKTNKAAGLLYRGEFTYYVGSAIFSAGIALLALGTAFIVYYKIHYGSEPEQILLSTLFMGVGTTLVLVGVNLMMRQTRFGYFIVAASASLSLLALLIFKLNYPQDWYYPLISYGLTLYISGFLVLLGNAFANVILWLIESRPAEMLSSVLGRRREAKKYSNEEIERDIEEATRKSVELSATKLRFKDLGAVQNVRLGKAFRESRGKTVRFKDSIKETESLGKIKRPVERVRSGSAEVENISKSLEAVLKEGAVQKGRGRGSGRGGLGQRGLGQGGRFEELKDIISGVVEKFCSVLGLKRKGKNI